MPRRTRAEEKLEERLAPVEAAISAFRSQIEKLTQAVVTATTSRQTIPSSPVVPRNHRSPTSEDIPTSTRFEEPTFSRVDERRSVKLSGLPKPEKLEESYSFAQFNDWKRRYVNYLIAEGALRVPTEQTNAILFSFLSQEICDVLTLVLNIPYGSDYDGVLDELDEYYRKKENGRIRRSQFTKRKQEEGESFKSFYREKTKLYQISDPCSHCYERCLIDNIIESLRDEREVQGSS
ncbi:hypothetical protein GE061_005964 [Apolygus lucorum]|uniref:Uncharacterized protein n=1 Tax=Apolygus lucorum TaxID=248454 RepID=A0A8S9WV02_APOLU|nr:hypothetical protein GE061_005964 [Apolygus lucorum]